MVCPCPAWVSVGGNSCKFIHLVVSVELFFSLVITSSFFLSNMEVGLIHWQLIWYGLKDFARFGLNP